MNRKNLLIFVQNQNTKICRIQLLVAVSFCKLKQKWWW